MYFELPLSVVITNFSLSPTKAASLGVDFCQCITVISPWISRTPVSQTMFALQSKRKPFAISTFPIIHFVRPTKFYISIVFNFSWDIQSSQEKLKTTFMQNFAGQSKCIMGNVEVVNGDFGISFHTQLKINKISPRETISIIIIF